MNWNSSVTYTINKNKIKKMMPATVTPSGVPVEPMKEMQIGGTDGYRMIL